MKAHELLNEAATTVKDRHERYGDVSDNFQVIAEFWTTWLQARGAMAPGQVVLKADVAQMLTLVKQARAAHNIEYADNWLDGAGYQGLGAEVSVAAPRECKAVQRSDQMVCEVCSLTWDMNDPRPPACELGKKRPTKPEPGVYTSWREKPLGTIS